MLIQDNSFTYLLVALHIVILLLLRDGAVCLIQAVYCILYLAKLIRKSGIFK